MASVYTRHDSPFFWINYRAPNGERKNKKTAIRIDSPSGRRNALKEAQLESANEGQLTSRSHGQALSQWVPTFLKQHYEERQPAAYKRYRQCWSALEIYLRDANIVVAGQITKKVAKDYAFWRIKPPAGSGVKKARWNTAILEIKFLARLMDEAVDRGHIIGNPCVRLGLKRERPKEKHPFSIEDQAIVEKALEDEKTPEWMRVSWIIAMRQGCRISETQIPLAWVDLVAVPPTIKFRIKRDAGGDRYHLAPLHPDLVPMMEKMKREKRKFTCILPPSAAKMWHKWLSKLSLSQHYSFHSTRVTVVTRLAADNFSQPMVKDYVGHASTTVNDVYRKLRPRDLVGMSASLAAAKPETPDAP